MTWDDEIGPNIAIPLTYEQWEFYEFGIFRVNKEWYVGYDAGCSCPTPWEDTKISDLQGPLSTRQVLVKINLLESDGTVPPDTLLAYKSAAKKTVRNWRDE